MDITFKTRLSWYGCDKRFNTHAEEGELNINCDLFYLVIIE